jgi:hypothetical protein
MGYPDRTATVTNHGAGPTSRTHLAAVALRDLYGHAFVTGLRGYAVVA